MHGSKLDIPSSAPAERGGRCVAAIRRLRGRKSPIAPAWRVPAGSRGGCDPRSDRVRGARPQRRQSMDASPQRPRPGTRWSAAARLLRTRRKRPRQRAAEQRDELASFHSMTSSARANSVGGMVRPRAVAVLRLMTSSIFIGCSTGSSAGSAPFRILST